MKDLVYLPEGHEAQSALQTTGPVRVCKPSWASGTRGLGYLFCCLQVSGASRVALGNVTTSWWHRPGRGSWDYTFTFWAGGPQIPCKILNPMKVAMSGTWV